MVGVLQGFYNVGIQHHSAGHVQCRERVLEALMHKKLSYVQVSAGFYFYFFFISSQYSGFWQVYDGGAAFPLFGDGLLLSEDCLFAYGNELFFYMLYLCKQI